MGLLQKDFSTILDNFVGDKKLPYKNNPMRLRICQTLKQDLISSLPELSKASDYFLDSSIGSGGWADCPWLMISDPKITTTPQNGVYIVFLFSGDGSSVYLTLNQGVTKTDTKDILSGKLAQDVRAILDCGSFSSSPFSLHSPHPKKTGRPELYEKATICWRRYDKGNVPDDTVLIKDLREMLGIYAQYLALPKQAKGEMSTMENETKKDLEAIKAYIAANGFTYPVGLIENFYLSLKAKPFVILAGVSGTGKTKLVKLFAEAVGATAENHRYLLVPVRPDWSDSSDLLGHVDLNGRFVPGAIIDFISAAGKDLSHPYFLCLDEMNLARVEYYFSDFLSIMETRKRKNPEDPIVTDRLIPEQFLGEKEDEISDYRGLILPENLYLIGTVNMDETTFPFSKKVLDRANMIEFSDIDLTYNGGENQSIVTPAPLDLPNSFFKANYLTLGECPSSKDLTEMCENLQDLNGILSEANMQVGYRVRDEAVFYEIENEKDGLITPEQAFDNILMQKVLPRVQGGSTRIRDMLCDLFVKYVGKYDDSNQKTGNVADKMDLTIKSSKTLLYPKTAAKIAYMMRRYQEDGFTSYWL